MRNSNVKNRNVARISFRETEILTKSVDFGEKKRYYQFMTFREGLQRP